MRRTWWVLWVMIILYSLGNMAWAQETIPVMIHHDSVAETVYFQGWSDKSTYVSVRDVSDNTGIPIKWYGDTKSVVFATYSQNMVLTSDLEQVYLVGDEVKCVEGQTKPRVVKGKVYMPLRMLEQLGIGVHYNNNEDVKISLYVPGELNKAKGNLDESYNQVKEMIVEEISSKPQIVGTYTTYFNPANKPRTKNLTLAAQSLNNTELKPGQIFSFNKTVGPRTPQRGYEKAIIFVNKKEVEGYGGGVCQVSTTVYNAVLKGDLKVVERYPHSLPVPYVPKGKDATVSYGWLDFKFMNDSDKPLLLQASILENKLKIDILKLPGGEKSVAFSEEGKI